MRIGWIGTGVMGQAMCGRLLDAGHACTIFNRTKSRAAALCDRGAVWAESPAEVARQSDVVFTIVGFPEDVRSVVLAPETGVLAGFLHRKAQMPDASPAILVDMTTSRPSLACEIASEAAKYGILSLDAPVSGGDVGAKNGTLSIMVGGDAGAFEELAPVWKVLGKKCLHAGAAGAGQHTKMVNQILIAGTMMGLCEALRYMDAVGLVPQTTLEAVGGGAAGSWSLDNLAPRVLKGDFAPGFKVRHFLKDLKIALDEARTHSLHLPGLELAERLYETLNCNGFGENGTQALFQLN